MTDGQRPTTNDCLLASIQDCSIRTAAIWSTTCAAALDRHLGFPQQAVGLGGGQAFVPEVDGQAEAAADFFGEGLHLFGLDPFAAVMRRGRPITISATLCSRMTCSSWAKSSALVLPLKGFQSLRRDAQRVGNGEADPPRAYVHAQNSLADARRAEASVWWEGTWRLYVASHIFAVRLRYRYGH